MLKCFSREGRSKKRQRVVNEWRWQPNTPGSPLPTALTQPFSTDIHAHVDVALADSASNMQDARPHTCILISLNAHAQTRQKEVLTAI